MGGRNQPTFGIICFWFGGGLLLAAFCSVKIALFIAACMLILMGFCIIK